MDYDRGVAFNEWVSCWNRNAERSTGIGRWYTGLFYIQWLHMGSFC